MIWIHERKRWSPGNLCLLPRRQIVEVLDSNDLWPGDHCLCPNELNGSVEGDQMLGPTKEMAGF